MLSKKKQKNKKAKNNESHNQFTIGSLPSL